jgi:HlyD family type I secretion membrane fusion protein
MSLALESARQSRLARIRNALRPWWPHAMTLDDPVDASLIDWMSPQRIVYAGLVVIAVVFGALALWDGATELEKGATAEAVVEAASYRKVIDSRYPGVVKEILVAENQEVQAGQPLLVLDSTEAEATEAILQRTLLSDLARVARLVALRDETEPSWPQELIDAATNDRDAAAILNTNRNAFNEVRDTLNGQIEVIRTQIRQVEHSITGKRANKTAALEQLALIRKESEGVSQLLAQGLERKPKMLELQRTASQLQGEIAAADADIARGEVQLRELNLHVESAKADMRDKVVKELAQAQARILETEDRLRGQRDIVRLTTLYAPQAGRIIRLEANTPGAAIKAGDKLMEIAPTNDSLLLRVAVSPHNIADVVPGTKARVRIEGAGPGLRRLEGVVTDVSPDTTPHARIPGASAYIADIEVHTDKLDANAVKRLRAGMPAHVKLITGTRSVWTYMTESLFDSLTSHERLLEESQTRQ